MLGDLLTAAGDPAGATKAYETVRFIEQLGDIQASTYDRQLLRFELDHGGATAAVLERARASVAERPDWTGHDTVAWSLYRLGRFEEAAAEITAARSLGADDARLRFHEGAILSPWALSPKGSGCSRPPSISGQPSIPSNGRKRRRCSTVEQADGVRRAPVRPRA